MSEENGYREILAKKLADYFSSWPPLMGFLLIILLAVGTFNYFQNQSWQAVLVAQQAKVETVAFALLELKKTEQETQNKAVEAVYRAIALDHELTEAVKINRSALERLDSRLDRIEVQIQNLDNELRRKSSGGAEMPAKKKTSL